ncbi:putative ATP-grasp-modified RiPP [Streptomyces sp. NPDC002845]
MSRPFALRLLSPRAVASPPPRTAGQRFDPVRQITVGANGVPAPFGAGTSPTMNGPLSPGDAEGNTPLL